MTNNAYKWQYIEDTGKFLETYKLFYLLRKKLRSVESESVSHSGVSDSLWPHTL